MIPEITIPLSMPPGSRWQLTDRQTDWARELVQATVGEFGGVHEYAEPLSLYAHSFLSAEIRSEIHSLSDSTGCDFVEVLASNLYYDFVKLLLGCTAFAVNTDNGPLHARNMDWFSHGNCLSEFTSIISFLGEDDQVRFRSIGWPGCVGVLSAMAPGRFAVTLNAVLSDEPMQMANSVAVMIREVCQTASDFQEAVELFSSRPITSDCLLLVTGVNSDEMVVVERTPTRHVIRRTENDFIIVTNDYRMLDCPEVESSGEIYDTTCSRFNAANRCLADNFPTTVNECFDILNHSDVRMRITVQQMVMCAKSDTLQVKTNHQESRLDDPPC